MSSILVFSIRDKIEYENSVKISKKLISYCLSKNLGIIFNFLGYDENLIRSLQSTFYFSISDDFLQLNSEFLTTSDIMGIENEKGKKFF